MSLLDVAELRAGYDGIPILSGVSLYVSPGEAVGVLGRNGVGKTTLMRALMGTVKTTGGSVLLDSESMSGRRVHERVCAGFAFVPQGREIFERLTVRENLVVGVHGTRRRRMAAVEQSVAEFPGLAGLLDRLGGALSGGQQQLLALGRALATNPKILLLDEPTEGVQPSFVDTISVKLKEVQEKRGTALLLVEQNLDFAAGLVQRAYVMDTGEVHREIKPSQLLTDATLQSEFIAGSHSLND